MKGHFWNHFENISQYELLFQELFLAMTLSPWKQKQLNYSMLVMLLPLIGTNDFHVKAENERFTAAGSSCRQNIQFENFTSLFRRLLQINVRASSVARLFFRIQPIIYY